MGGRMTKTGCSLILFVFIALTGCSQGLILKVDSIAAREAGPGQSYVLLSDMENVSEDDLYFREFSAYVHAALRQHGFQRAASSGSAALKVYFSYGVTPGAMEYYVTSTPIYEWVGGEVVTYSETETDADGNVLRKSGRTTLPYREEVVGYDQIRHSYTPYTSHVILDARNAKSGAPVWKTTVTATDGKAGDLRGTMPILIDVAAPWVGRDTRGIKTIKLKPKRQEAGQR
jgi:hypothetical protein